jgi:hypothetical protein
MVLEKSLIRLIEKTLSRNFLGEDYTLTKMLSNCCSIFNFPPLAFSKT